MVCKALFTNMSFLDQIKHQLAREMSPDNQAFYERTLKKENIVLEAIDQNYAKVFKMIQVEMRPLGFFYSRDFFSKHGIGSVDGLTNIHGIQEVGIQKFFQSREKLIEYLQRQKAMVTNATKNAFGWVRGMLMTEHLKTIKDVAEYPNYDPMAHKLANDIYMVTKSLSPANVLMIKKILQMGVKEYDLAVFMKTPMKTAVIEFRVELLTSNQKATLSFKLQLEENERPQLSREELFSEDFLSGGTVQEVILYRPTEHTQVMGYELYFHALHNGRVSPSPIRSTKANDILYQTRLGMTKVYEEDINP